MKRHILVFALVAVTASLGAQSVWTGNAAVGGIADFPGESDVYRALSNSFPPGTVLKVSNPRGGRSVDVTVTGRLESPGVFILMEQQAGDNISLPTDHVVPVRVTPYSANSEISSASQTLDESALSEDTDFNPAASIAPEDETEKTVELVEESGTEPLAVPVDPYPFIQKEPENIGEEADAEALIAEDDQLLADAAVPVELSEPTPSEEVPEEELEIEELIDTAESAETIEPVETIEPEETVPPVDPETIFLYDLASSEPENEGNTSGDASDPTARVPEPPDGILSSEVPEPETPDEESSISPMIVEEDLQPAQTISEAVPARPFIKEPKEIVKAGNSESLIEVPESDTVIDGGESVFFLMPSDPKPPEAPDAVAEASDTAVGNETPEPDKDGTILASSDPDGGTSLARVSSTGRYVQIGAYGSLSILEDSARRIETSVPGYPLSYAEAGSGSSRIYRLLVGPLKPAEVGVVLQTARNSSFPDAFPYSP